MTILGIILRAVATDYGQFPYHIDSSKRRRRYHRTGFVDYRHVNETSMGSIPIGDRGTSGRIFQDEHHKVQEALKTTL